VKIAVTFVYILALFLIRDFGGHAVAAAALGVAVAVSRVPPKFILRGLKAVFIIILFTFTLNMLMTKGEPLIKAGFIVVTKEGLYNAVFMGLRLVLLIVGSSLLTLTTKPVRLTDGIESLLKPFRRFGVPAHELAMMMTIALRFIPTLLEETDKIMKAQMARGADFESGSILRRAKNMTPLLVPLFIGAFRIAQDLAMAMEARCYRGGEGRTSLHELRLRKQDAAAIFLTAVFLSFILLERWLSPLWFDI
jgi:energy-coupling factor transport system permease protein